MVNAYNFSGFLAFVFFLAVPVAAILGVIVKARYRKAIKREMMARSGAPESAFDVPQAIRPNRSTLEFDVSPATQRLPFRFGLAFRYLVSGVVFAIMMVVVIFAVDETEFLPVRFTVFVASFALPAIIMALYVANVRWYWILLFSVFWMFLLSLVEQQSASIAGIYVVPALILSLVVGNPSLRTTAIPLFLVAVSLVVPLIFSLDFMYFLMVAGVFDFLLLILPVPLVSAFYVLTGLAVSFAIGVAFALIIVRIVARPSDGSSELTMQHDLLWLFQTIWMIGFAWGSAGAIVLSYVLAFAAYRVTLRLLRPTSGATDVNLLLRVFGQRRLQTSLARGLLLDWRRTGPVLLVGSADLATETLDAPELSALLTRRLRDIFIETPDDLKQAEAEGNTRLSDGLFPMRDFYCRDNSWRPTVLTLMSHAQRVLIDMRGFEQSNTGIQFEIMALAQRVPADRIIVLVDKKSLQNVQALFSDIWSKAGNPQGMDRLRCLVQN